jgi:hypothetical protein
LILSLPGSDVLLSAFLSVEPCLSAAFLLSTFLVGAILVTSSSAFDFPLRGSEVFLSVELGLSVEPCLSVAFLDLDPFLSDSPRSISSSCDFDLLFFTSSYAKLGFSIYILPWMNISLPPSVL